MLPLCCDGYISVLALFVFGFGCWLVTAALYAGIAEPLSKQQRLLDVGGLLLLLSPILLFYLRIDGVAPSLPWSACFIPIW